MYVYFLNDEPGRASWLAQACQSGGRVSTHCGSTREDCGLPLAARACLALVPCTAAQPSAQPHAAVPQVPSLSLYPPPAFLLLALRRPMQSAQHPHTCHFSCRCPPCALHISGGEAATAATRTALFPECLAPQGTATVHSDSKVISANDKH